MPPTSLGFWREILKSQTTQTGHRTSRPQQNFIGCFGLFYPFLIMRLKLDTDWVFYKWRLRFEPNKILKCWCTSYHFTHVIYWLMLRQLICSVFILCKVLVSLGTWNLTREMQIPVRKSKGLARRQISEGFKLKSLRWPRIYSHKIYIQLSCCGICLK